VEKGLGQKKGFMLGDSHRINGGEGLGSGRPGEEKALSGGKKTLRRGKGGEEERNGSLTTSSQWQKQKNGQLCPLGCWVGEGRVMTSYREYQDL